MRLIDADELIGKLRRMPVFEKNNSFKHMMYVEKSCIDAMPTVDAVEVVHGQWKEKILVGGFAEEWGYVCSNCGCTVSDRSKLGVGRYAYNNQRLNYCPNCGAKMDGGTDNGEE